LRGGQLDYENAFPAEEGTDVDSESSIDLGWNADIGDRELANDGAGGRGEEPGLGERQGEGGAGDDAGAVRFAAFGIKPGGKIDRQYGGRMGVGGGDQSRARAGGGTAQTEPEERVDDQVGRRERDWDWSTGWHQGDAEGGK
jgi:hypothetical protein